MATKTKSTPATATLPTADQPETFAFVVKHTPLLHDGALYQIGEDVPLTEAQALRQGANVAPAPAESKPE